QRDVAALERLAVRLHLGAVPGYDAAPIDHAAILDDGLAVDEVHDPLAAEHERLGRDPAVAVDRRRRRLDAMRLVELPAVDDVGAGRAHVPGRTRPFAEPAEKLK